MRAPMNLSVSIAAASLSLCLLTAGPARPAPAGQPDQQHPGQALRLERHFTVTHRPVVTIQSAASGRVEVKSWKNPEVVIKSNAVSDHVAVEMEQADSRIALTSTLLDKPSRSADSETNFEITVPEETDLEIHTTNMGTIYIEQVYGDMTLESRAGDVHLKEVSGYIIVKTMGGSLMCTQCAGKLNFSSVSGNAQFLQPQLNSLNATSTSGNLIYDGDFVRTGIYTLKSGTGLVEVRFSDSDSFDLRAITNSGTVDNQAAAFLKPDSHGLKGHATRFAHSLAGTVNAGLAQVNLSTFSGTIRIRKRD